MDEHTPKQGDVHTTAPVGDVAPPLKTLGGGLLSLHAALAGALDTSAAPLVVVDAEQRFLRVNTAACAFFGRAPDDLLGRRAEELLVQESTSAAHPQVTATDRLVDGEWCFQRPDGGRVWGRVGVLGSEQDSVDTDGHVVIIEDVTESRRAQRSEQALLEEVRNYQLMFERGSIGQMTMEIPGFRISAVNQVLCSLMGYTREELIGGDGTSVFGFGSRWDQGPTDRLLKGEIDSYVMERELPSKGGTPFVSVLDTVCALRREDGSVREIMVLVQELTMQRAAEQATRDSQTLLQTAIASSPIAVTAFDRDLRFTFLAGASVTDAGSTLSDFLGHDVRELVTDAATVAALEAALAGTVSSTRSLYAGRTFSTVHAPLRQGTDEITGVISVSTDISAEVASEAANSHTRILLDHVLKAIPLLVAGFDADGRLIEGAGRLYAGGPWRSLEGRRLDGPDGNGVVAGYVDRAIGGEELVGVIEYQGSIYQGYYSPNRDSAGRLIGALAVVTDITARHRAEQEALHAAQHDPLTGLPLAALLVEHVDAMLAGPSGQACTLLIVHLDDLPAVNHSLGPEVGDAVLRQFAAGLTAALPEALVATLGGDSFAVVVSGVERTANAPELVKRVTGALRPLDRAGEPSVTMTASIGIAFGVPGNPAAALLRDADSALYQAKHGGRSKVCVYDAESRRRVQHRLVIESGLREALRSGTLQMAYQPIVSLLDGSILDVEALVRWDDPMRGTIPPSEFIPIAESSGLILPMGAWIMRQACLDISGLQDAYHLNVSVNVSIRQLTATGFSAALDAILAESGLPPGALTLEVTESALSHDLGAVRIAFEKLRARGVRISIDDFGTGYSSLARLQRLPVDIIKLDQAFVVEVAERPRARIMAGAIYELSKALGASIIAEGIENEAQAATLRELGYEAVQGFLFARPMPLEHLRHMLTQRAESPSGPAATTGPRTYVRPRRHVAAFADARPRSEGEASAPREDAARPAHAAAAEIIDARLPRTSTLLSDHTTHHMLITFAQAVRALNYAATAEEVVEICSSVVRSLGGTVAPARLAGADALPLDLSFGQGEPLLPLPPTPQVREALTTVLPDLLEDARATVARLLRAGVLASEATVDGMTGLLNRRSVDRVLARVRPGDVVLFMDLDGFKAVNDELGHGAGDIVLTAFARVLRQEGRGGDRLGRYGGDEFIVILPGATTTDAQILLKRLRAAWSAVRPQPVTFSAGIARAHGSNAADVLAAADRALYQDKAERQSARADAVTRTSSG